jgi:hypothetical protein
MYIIGCYRVAMGSPIQSPLVLSPLLHLSDIGSNNKHQSKVLVYNTKTWEALPVEIVHPQLVHPSGIAVYKSHLLVLSMDTKSLLAFDKMTGKFDLVLLITNSAGQFERILITFDKEDPEHLVVVTE